MHLYSYNSHCIICRVHFGSWGDAFCIYFCGENDFFWITIIGNSSRNIMKKMNIFVMFHTVVPCLKVNQS